jgi:hypothetical protein
MGQLYLPHKQNIIVRKLEKEITEPRKKYSKRRRKKVIKLGAF